MTKVWVLIDGFTRAYPMFIVLYSFLSGLLNNESEGVMLGFYLLGTDVFNHFLKLFIFKPRMKDKCFPILGYGCRPPKCKNTGLFKDGRISTSYGMPSGHAQVAWTFTSYWCLKLWNEGERSIDTKILPIVMLLCCAALISYSRVGWAKCHSTQQVIVGSLIGIPLGFLGYMIIASKKEPENIKT